MDLSEVACELNYTISEYSIMEGSYFSSAQSCPSQSLLINLYQNASLLIYNPAGLSGTPLNS